MANSNGYLEGRGWSKTPAAELALQGSILPEELRHPHHLLGSGAPVNEELLQSLAPQEAL